MSVNSVARHFAPIGCVTVATDGVFTMAWARPEDCIGETPMKSGSPYRVSQPRKAFFQSTPLSFPKRFLNEACFVLCVGAGDDASLTSWFISLTMFMALLYIIQKIPPMAFQKRKRAQPKEIIRKARPATDNLKDTVPVTAIRRAARLRIRWHP